MAVVFPWCVAAQQATPSDVEKQPKQEAGSDNTAPDKRAYGILPNYRTVNGTDGVEPLTVRRKFWIASKDSFDYPIYFISAGFAGISQIENSNPSFGQGIKGYAMRYAAGYGDQLIGNMMTEGVFPSLLHEDMRYFRRGTGGTLGRTFYALTRILVTRTDAGRNRFNFSEVAGNSTAVAISNAYNPDTRNASENLEKLGLQLGTDAISNVLKEFWPDVKARLQRRHNAVTP
ncbi:MAG: hypothetical protein LAP39_23075 [Acidobacteriia bacterium]|nr:hypothetical protein [Terriglobia bacterium]